MKTFGIIKWIRSHRKLFILLVVVAILLLLLLFVYNNNSLLYYTDEFARRIGMENPFMDYFIIPVSRFTNQFDLKKTRIAQRMLALDVYDLRLSGNDIKYFEDLTEQAIKIGYLSDEINRWRNARIQINGEEYDMKIKLIGDLEDHWSDYDKSYAVKFTDRYYRNIRRLNFKICSDKNSNQGIYDLENYYADLLNIKLYRRSSLGLLKINGRSRGIYQVEEHIDDSYFERNGLSTTFLIKQSDNWFDDLRAYRKINHPEANGVSPWKASHNTPFVGELSNLDSDFAPSDRAGAYAYQDMLKNDDLIEYMDLEQFTSYYAALTMFGSPHSFTGDNFIMVFDCTAGRLIPVFDIDSVVLRLGSHIENQIGFYGKAPNYLASILIRNDEFRLLKNKKIYSIVSDPEIRRKSFQLIDRNYKIFKYDQLTTSRINKYEHYKALKIFRNNFDVLKSSLEYATLYCSVVQDRGRITVELIPDTFAAVSIDRCRIYLDDPLPADIEYRLIDHDETIISGGRIDTREGVGGGNILDLGFLFEEHELLSGLDENMYLAVRKYKLEISSALELGCIESADIRASNSITGSEIAGHDIYIALADGRHYFSGMRKRDMESKEDIRNWIGESGLPFIFANGALVLHGGNYTVSKDIVIPEGTEMILEPGVSLSLGEGRSILSYSPVVIRGTESAPVVIRGSDPEPFGTFAIVGNDDGRAEISHLDLSGGSEAYVDGLYLSGALSIYHVGSVKISDSIVHDNEADDGVNVKYCSEFEMRDNRFFDNFADQVDLDFCRGFVSGNTFKSEGGDSNGDGLDLSGSVVIASDNHFSGFEDKAVSIGEKTDAYLAENTFLDNRSAITAKDSSRVVVFLNKYSDNEKQIELYIKKPIYNSPECYNLGDEVEAIDREKGSAYYILSEDYHHHPDGPVGMSFFDYVFNLPWSEIK